MAKNLKLKIKNTQLAKAVDLAKPKKAPAKKAPAKKKADAPKKKEAPPVKANAPVKEEAPAVEKRRVRAKKRSDFAPPTEQEQEAAAAAAAAPPVEEPAVVEEPPPAEPVVEEEPAAPEVKEEPKEQPKEAEKKEEKKKEEPPKKRKIDLNKLPPRARGGFRGKQFRDVKPKPSGPAPRFDSRDRQGLRSGEDERWRRSRRRRAPSAPKEDTTIRPSELTVRLPISVKDLAAEMKLKASQLLSTLFMQGVAMTLNDSLVDETTVQLLGEEFKCAITIDTTEEERLRITDKTVGEEIAEADEKSLKARPPVIAFMGHVDHGKTSLIDAIRESNRVAGEAGAITQHIGAFQCKTSVGTLTILDTPGHEAFTSMRARGAKITDVVILVIAGDEGMMPQTIEALQHAQAAGVAIVVALNKCDKDGFNAENVYRQLSEHGLLPEAWGGDTIAVPCSAVSGEGIDQLLEMTALQAEVLELGANPSARARGRVVESEMHKGLGVVATVLIQNGTLRKGDAVVFEQEWGRIKTMRDEHGRDVDSAPPSFPVEITGLSGMPSAGEEFIVVDSEKEAKEISEGRREGQERRHLQAGRPISMESLLAEAAGQEKKVLHLILRADVQGSLEALRASLEKIESDKAELDVIFSGVGAISESDVELAIASQAVILGFHTQVESHAEQQIRQSKVVVRMHDVIYHAIDDVKELMTGRLEKVGKEEERGKAEIRATFKAGHRFIAGCMVTDGVVGRNDRVRLIRDGEKIWEGMMTSLRRDTEDVREVKKGLECGILLEGFNEIAVGDQLETYEIVYVSQEL